MGSERSIAGLYGWLRTYQLGSFAHSTRSEYIQRLVTQAVYGNSVVSAPEAQQASQNGKREFYPNSLKSTMAHQQS